MIVNYFCVISKQPNNQTMERVIQILVGIGMPENKARRQLENNTLNLNPYWENATDDIVIALAENCAGLTTINLKWCKNITNAAVIALAEGCEYLADIDLDLCINITDAAAMSLRAWTSSAPRIDLANRATRPSPARAPFPPNT